MSIWYKSWLETRWRFLIGFALLACSAVANVMIYPKLMALLPTVAVPAGGGPLARQIREALELSREFRGYVWSNWFGQNLRNMGTLFAVILGTGGILAHRANGALFTLSLPVSRKRVLGVRAAAGLAELLVLVFVPSLLIPLIAPAVGKSYGAGDALVQSLCLFIVTSVFFALAFLLSTSFSDPWRPVLITLAVAFAVGLVDQVVRSTSFGVFRVMSAELYFRTGHVPWGGLLASAAASAALYFAAAANVARRDF